jgi:hypothetical protein
MLQPRHQTVLCHNHGACIISETRSANQVPSPLCANTASLLGEAANGREGRPHDVPLKQSR